VLQMDTLSPAWSDNAFDDRGWNTDDCPVSDPSVRLVSSYLIHAAFTPSTIEIGSSSRSSPWA
jgi:hypothetical protein